MQKFSRYLLCKPSYSYFFCVKIRNHGNKGWSEVNFNKTVRFCENDFLKGCIFGNQKLCCGIFDEFIMWALVIPEVTCALNRQPISSLVEKSTPLCNVIMESWSQSMAKFR